MNCLDMDYTDWKGKVARTSRLLHKMWNVWIPPLPPLWTLLVFHATLSGGLRLCLSPADVLSGARLSRTRLHWMDTEGRRQGKEALGYWQWEQRWRHMKDKGSDTPAPHTHLLDTPNAHTSHCNLRSHIHTRFIVHADRHAWRQGNRWECIWLLIVL